MEVYSDRQLAKDQAARLRQGFSAYAETNSLASLIKKNFNHTISKSTRTLLISAAGSSPSQMNTKRGSPLYSCSLHNVSRSAKIRSASSQL